MRRILHGILIVAMGIAPQAFAEDYDANEVSALPEYCRYTLGFRDKFGGNEDAASYWRQRLGPEMGHMHHYCRGLMFVNRARGSIKERAKWYGLSIGEFDYILKNVKPGYVLLPEMLTRKGEALVHLHRLGEAEPILRKAIEIKPDYWPAYARLAEGFIMIKSSDKAREILKQGLSKVRDRRALQRMLDDLDQKR